jgi:hypothetical protein
MVQHCEPLVDCWKAVNQNDFVTTVLASSRKQLPKCKDRRNQESCICLPVDCCSAGVDGNSRTNLPSWSYLQPSNQSSASSREWWYIQPNKRATQPQNLNDVVYPSSGWLSNLIMLWERMDEPLSRSPPFNNQQEQECEQHIIAMMWLVNGIMINHGRSVLRWDSLQLTQKGHIDYLSSQYMVATRETKWNGCARILID